MKDELKVKVEGKIYKILSLYQLAVIIDRNFTRCGKPITLSFARFDVYELEGLKKGDAEEFDIAEELKPIEETKERNNDS